MEEANNPLARAHALVCSYGMVFVLSTLFLLQNRKQGIVSFKVCDLLPPFFPARPKRWNMFLVALVQSCVAIFFLAYILTTYNSVHDCCTCPYFLAHAHSSSPPQSMFPKFVFCLAHMPATSFTGRVCFAAASAIISCSLARHTSPTFEHVFAATVILYLVSHHTPYACHTPHQRRT